MWLLQLKHGHLFKGSKEQLNQIMAEMGGCFQIFENEPTQEEIDKALFDYLYSYGIQENFTVICNDNGLFFIKDNGHELKYEYEQQIRKMIEEFLCRKKNEEQFIRSIGNFGVELFERGYNQAKNEL